MFHAISLRRKWTWFFRACFLLSALTAFGYALYAHSDWRRVISNSCKLRDCDPIVADRVRAAIAEAEAVGFKPWIRETWRSQEDQKRAFAAGRSELKFGFHNVTGAHGEHRSFAADVAETEKQPRTTTKYALTLAVIAARQKLVTGVLWGLSTEEQQAITTVMRDFDPDCDFSHLRIGWDPCHLQPQDISLDEARKLAGMNK